MTGTLVRFYIIALPTWSKVGSAKVTLSGLRMTKGVTLMSATKYV